MKNLEDILKILRERKAYLQQKYGIKAIAVFGSYARAEQTEDSDVDVMVELGDKELGMRYLAMAREIENFLQHKTDVVARDAIKPRYFEAIKSDLHYA